MQLYYTLCVLIKQGGKDKAIWKQNLQMKSEDLLSGRTHNNNYYYVRDINEVCMCEIQDFSSKQDLTTVKTNL